MDEQQPSWANPLPWAVMSVAVLTACAGSVYAELIPASAAPLLVGILLACSLPQLLAGLILFRRGEILVATLCGLFGTVITLGAAITLWQQVSAPDPAAFTPEAMGVFWIVLFALGEIIAIGLGRASWFIMAGIAEVALAFLFLGISALAPSQDAGIIAGYLLVVFSAFCVYASAAMVLGEHFERPVLPLGGPIFK
jgi:succinate-acetate transporter protein